MSSCWRPSLEHVQLQAKALDRGLAMMVPRAVANHAQYAEVQGLVHALKQQLLGQ